MGDIADIVGGGTPSTGNQSYWDGDIDWYAPAEIADQIYANSSQKKITGLGYENSSAKMLPPGTVLFTSRAGIGKTAILTRKGCTNQGFQSIVPHRGELDSYFIFSRTEELKRYGELVGAGSTFVEVSGKQMAVMELMMPPTMREQQTIGGFFQQLDHLITLHQRQPFSHSTPDISLSVQLIHPFYTSSWEQRKLTEFVEFFSGLTYTPNDVQENGTLVLRSSNVSNGEVVDADNIYVNPQVVNSENVKVGDIVVVVRNGSRSLIGKHAQIKAFMPNTVIGAFMTGIRSECPEFTNALLNTSRFEEEIAMNMGATINQITGYMFSKMEFKVPCLDEQKKIGEYFEKLDNLITLHQRKFEKLTNVKKSMLEKMFPQNGSSYPEIRFKGFTDPWEQRKFEEIAVRSSVICSDDTFPRVEYEDIVSGTGRLNKDIYAKQSSKSGIAFHQGDVLYGKLRPYLQNWLLPTFDGLAVGDFWVLQPQNADSSFLYRLIQSRQFDEVANQSTGTKMPRADWKLVSKTVFSIPSNISEQAAIGTYFTALDSLITLHQRELEKLQNIKKSMLEKMFV